jgi:hypothetical protein
MSAPKKSEPTDGQGVLSRLPRTRPQRASARRAAARKTTAATGASDATPRKTAARPTRSTAAVNGQPPVSSKDSRAKAARKAKAASASAARKRARAAAKNTADATTGTTTREAAPRQGFDGEGERTSGTVQPPGGAELVAGAAELIGELAKAGISTGERLIKDLLSRLPLS